MICLRAGRLQHTWTWTDDSTEGKWRIMFFSFDYVIKEMVNVAAVQPWSYGCTREMANHERSVRVARGYSQMQLKLLECLANLPRASITPWLHSCNVYHFFNITKRENIYIWLQLSHRYEFMYAVICLRVNKSCFSKTCLCRGKSSYGSQNCNWNSPTQPALKRRVSNYI